MSSARLSWRCHHAVIRFDAVSDIRGKGNQAQRYCRLAGRIKNALPANADEGVGDHLNQARTAARWLFNITDNWVSLI
ncbi:hypothetical protein BN434_2942 [Erwinia amylovora CFBP 2585]|nr:hypothetical protein BN434_2942 [Erwinia amylovora CFBP 2585]